MKAASGLTFEEAKMKLEAFCAYQDRCTFEVENKMKTWELDEKDRSALLLYLVESRFLSDERFAESFVSGKVNIKRWGRNKLIAELRRKRITESLISKAISEVQDDVYFGNLKHLYDLKSQSLSNERDEYKRKVKLYRYLQSKGYTLDEIQDVYSSGKRT